MSRRKFLQAASVAAAASSGVFIATAQNKKMNWPIGCFNRPWMQGNAKVSPVTKPQPGTNWGYDVALAGMKKAGYKSTGLLTRTPEDPFIGSDATPEYLQQLKKKISASGLVANMGALRTKNDLPLTEQIKDVRQQIDNGKFLALEWILTFGVDKPEHYENYYKLMADAAAYSNKRGIKLVLKPHGGGSGASEEIIRCLEKVRHPNFKIWYDAGNIIYYTGKDPIEQLKPIVKHVVGFCAKDCDQQKGNVFIQFGTGQVDFRGVFTELKKAGFIGPVMVECCAGKTKEEVAENARGNREYLEKLFVTL